MVPGPFLVCAVATLGWGCCWCTTPASSNTSGTLCQEWRGGTPTSRTRDQHPGHPHHRSTTTGTSRQNTTSSVANDDDTQGTTNTDTINA